MKKTIIILLSFMAVSLCFAGTQCKISGASDGSSCTITDVSYSGNTVTVVVSNDSETLDANCTVSVNVKVKVGNKIQQSTFSSPFAKRCQHQSETQFNIDCKNPIVEVISADITGSKCIAELHKQDSHEYDGISIAGIRITRWVTCDRCNGKGEICITKKCYGCPGGTETKCVTCSKCNGKGRIQETINN
ncbi:MAG: hypothetical protein MJZ58_02760 [Paludibacteraceae bacterium]|nr:hypothetical protein [Paludibacteraceae bacterium]